MLLQGRQPQRGQNALPNTPQIDVRYGLHAIDTFARSISTETYQVDPVEPDRVHHIALHPHFARLPMIGKGSVNAELAMIWHDGSGRARAERPRGSTGGVGLASRKNWCRKRGALAPHAVDICQQHGDKGAKDEPQATSDQGDRGRDSRGGGAGMEDAHGFGACLGMPLVPARRSRRLPDLSIWSTPRNAHDHAAAIMRAVNRCPECHEG